LIRSSSRPASLAKNSSRFIRFSATAADVRSIRPAFAAIADRRPRFLIPALSSNQHSHYAHGHAAVRERATLRGWPPCRSPLNRSCGRASQCRPSAGRARRRFTHPLQRCFGVADCPSVLLCPASPGLLRSQGRGLPPSRASLRSDSCSYGATGSPGTDGASFAIIASTWR